MTTVPERPAATASVVPRVGRALAAIGLAAIGGVAILATADPTPARATAIAAWLVGGALVVLVLGLVARLVAVVGGSLVLLGAACATVHIHAGSGVPGVALLLGPVLLAVGELATWSIDLSPAAADEPGVFVARARWVGTVVLGTGGVGVLLAGLAQVRLAAQLPLDAMAVVAAVGLLGLAAALARPRSNGGAER